MMTELSILMPVYNEARTLRTIVARVLDSVDLDFELICVDDCSQDESLAILEEVGASDPRIRVVAHPVNRGKGRAIRTAIEHITGDIAIVQDADLEYDPAEIAKVVAPIVEGKADAVYGSRFAASEQRRVLFFWHALGNRVLTTLSNMANDLNLTDMETCYKAIRSDVLKRLRLTSDRFGFEPEVTARLAQWGARIYEVPISYHGRTYAEGKNIGWRDGVEAIWLIFKFRFLDTRATDEDSVVTRQSLGRAPRFRKWLLSRFEGYLGDRVLEVNAGPGHTTSHLLDRDGLVVIDSDPVHVDTLRRRFGHLENLTVLSGGCREVRDAGHRVATALVFDGLQRVEEPKEYLAEVAHCVESGGHVLIQVPAQSRLFGPLDEGAGHLRRFDPAELEEIVTAAGLELLRMDEFNRLGVVAWKFRQVSPSSRISRFEAQLFDLLVPLAKSLEPLLPWGGLSLLAVARVP